MIVGMDKTVMHDLDDLGLLRLLEGILAVPGSSDEDKVVSVLGRMQERFGGDAAEWAVDVLETLETVGASNAVELFKLCCCGERAVSIARLCVQELLAA